MFRQGQRRLIMLKLHARQQQVQRTVRQASHQVRRLLRVYRSEDGWLLRKTCETYWIYIHRRRFV
jgi:hypothetical protein